LKIVFEFQSVLGFFTVIALLLLVVCRWNNKLGIRKKHRNFKIQLQYYKRNNGNESRSEHDCDSIP
jgi:ABC-type protease/lipase transport system fused ATPase/permease subunit